MDSSQEDNLKMLGIHLLQSNSETDEEDDTPPNYIMVCHECGHLITRERACETTRKAKSGEMRCSQSSHLIYFVRNAIDGLRDKDILEALTHLDQEKVEITIEAEEFERLGAHVDHHDRQNEHQIDITYHGFDDGHFPFNRGILATGYRRNDDGKMVLMEPEMGNMLKDMNQDLGSDNTKVHLIELSDQNV